MRILMLCLFALITAPAWAAENGLSYTVLGAPNASENTPTTINMRAIEPAKPAAFEEDPEPNSPMTKVWKRYKALAAGEAGDEPKPMANGQIVRPDAPIAPTIEKPASGHGLTGLLQNYEAAKARRGQMRSVTVTTSEN